MMASSSSASAVNNSALFAPPVIETIFKYLPMRDVKNCAMVCRLWESVATSICKKRRSILSYIHVHACTGSKRCQQVAPTGKCDTEDVETALSRQFCDLYCDPRLVLLFCSESLHEKASKFFSRKLPIKKRRLTALQDCLEEDVLVLRPAIQCLPFYTQIAFCVAYGVIGTSRTSGNLASEEIERCPAMSGIAFPNVPGVEVLKFSRFQAQAPHATTYLHELSKHLADVNLKCLLFFMCNERVCHSFITDFFKGYKRDTAIGGAIVKHTNIIRGSTKGNEINDDNYVVAFSGDNIKAASIIIKSSANEKAKIEKKLIKMKEACNWQEGYSLAFMFSCVARGSRFYKEPNIESSIFRKIFPSVPLYGVFGDGEIGVDSLTTKKKKSRCWFHSYTSVFVLVSFGNK